MSVFKRAFESYDANPTGGEKDTVVMTGPLSDVYTEALNKVYAKGAEGDGVAQESAANDELMLRALAEDMHDTVDRQDGIVTTVYGVSAQGVTPQDVVNVTQKLADEPDEKVVLIIDGVQPGPNSPEDSIPAERVEVLTSAMESLVVGYGGQVYRSLNEFAAARAAAKAAQ
jgi:hypothetical protein